ncbi:MAG: S1/P1 Nuclease, partial [Caulobacteraceae bacterium]
APALAWGATGHRLIGQAAVQGLPPELPDLLRAASVEVGELSREPDRSRGSGDPHDADLNPGHFCNLDDDGRLGGMALDALPRRRADFDRAMLARGSGADRTGYLPYAMAAAWQQLVTDFAYWRVASWGERKASTPEARAWFAADRKRREFLILADAGAYSHYAGDASQPLHVTRHHDGWEGESPKGYPSTRLHARVEGAFVRQTMTLPAVAAKMPTYRARLGDPLAMAGSYIAETFAEVEPLYALEARGGFRDANADGAQFTAGRLGAGAAEVRDRITDAWRASGKAKVGYSPAVKVEDVETGRVDPFGSVLGKD